MAEKIGIPPLADVSQRFSKTAYDHFLADTIKSVRTIPTETFSYTLREKKLNKLDNDLFDKLEDSKATLVYNIYGNLKTSLDSAFTEKDILETIVECPVFIPPGIGRNKKSPKRKRGVEIPRPGMGVGLRQSKSR